MLKDILKLKKGFKLVCGAGNEDIDEVEKLVTIYAKAGCKFFDVSANIDVVDAAKRGFKRAGVEEAALCVSVGIAGDPHITKAQIDKKLCVGCASCASKCEHGAIFAEDKIYQIKKERCLGCGQCINVCPVKAITLQSQLKEYKEILPPIIERGIDCIEFHAISTDENDVDEKWQQLNELFDGMLCISLDRSELGDKRLKERVERLLSIREPYTTIIQADGVAMSGNNDEYGTTLQAVATAQLFQNANFPVYIMMSGGTNTKSTQLSKLCGVEINCLAVGSYARKIVKQYLVGNEIYNDEVVMNEAVSVAKSLIDVSISNM